MGSVLKEVENSGPHDPALLNWSPFPWLEQLTCGTPRVDYRYTLGGTMSTPTRQRLIDAAIRRFYRDGFRNVGVDQILTDVGISKTAFYKHFESKEDLMLAGLEGQNLWLQGTFRKMVQDRGGPSAIGQLRALFDVVE